MSKEVEYPEPRKSTLLYIETCVVDKKGKLESKRMNDGDFENIENMEEEGLLEVERMNMKQIEGKKSGNWEPTHKVTKFTDEAWEEAHKHRKERGTVAD